MVHPIIDQANRVGQSFWLDSLSRDMLCSGELARLVESGVSGLTSNPTIFDKALREGDIYIKPLRALVDGGQTPDSAVWRLMIEDIQATADLLLPTYQRTQAKDGYVSIEISPLLSDNTEGTLDAARKLWGAVDRPNLMVKVPGTTAGMPAVETLIAEGINTNVTLLFSVSAYEQAAAAYKRGLRKRIAQGYPVQKIASVASFFVSRIDTAVDQLLPPSSDLRGQTAIANARVAYARFQELFDRHNHSDEGFGDLHAAAAQVQRPLWASTSTKNPDYCPTLYIESLVGPWTVNTMPDTTLATMLGSIETITDTLTNCGVAAQAMLGRLATTGIDFDTVTADLLEAGLKAFEKSFAGIMQYANQNTRAVSA